MTSAAQKIEALLFLAGEAVSKNEIARLVELPIDEVDSLLDEVASSLAGHGISLTRTETHVQLVTSPAVSEYLNQYLQKEAEDLSAAAAETLSLIAYRGPISRADIDVIRGVDSRRMVRQLLSRDLIRKIDPSARIPAYAITEEFLQRLGITSTKELPEYETLSSHEKIEHMLTNEKPS